jgi:hypothetical protein
MFLEGIVASGNTETLQFLLNASISKEYLSAANGEALLPVAVNSRERMIVKRLVPSGANLNSRHEGNLPASIFAAQDQDLDLSGLLLEAGAGVDRTLDSSRPQHFQKR